MTYEKNPAHHATKGSNAAPTSINLKIAVINHDLAVDLPVTVTGGLHISWFRLNDDPDPQSFNTLGASVALNPLEPSQQIHVGVATIPAGQVWGFQVVVDANNPVTVIAKTPHGQRQIQIMGSGQKDPWPPPPPITHVFLAKLGHAEYVKRFQVFLSGGGGTDVDINMAVTFAL